ncbi:MAG: EAL domain-containing protein, partial [Alphaproteobacteria bacterium]|nr:EAL domain-containing protein [Alphaproteobacteria bacterium]
RQKKVSAERTRRRHMLTGTIIGLCGAIAIVGAVSRFASSDFTLIAAAMLGLCGVIVYDILSRRGWEQLLTSRFETLARNHDRLVREVARNRNELAQFKETLAQAGQAAEAQGRHLPPANTPEARMLETIVSKLGGLAELPRAQIESTWDDGVLELEMTPPPPRALPQTPFDGAITIDPARLSDGKVREYLQQAVRGDQIDVFVQPIVSLPQRKARIIEVFARIRAGNAGHLPAARYIEIAQKDDLMSAIDNLLLLRCLQMLRDSRDDGDALPCALNISAATLHDAGFMNDLVAFLAQNKLLAARLIFELPQSELLDLDDSLTPVLSGLSQLGCRFSMDRVQSRRLNVHRLKSQHVRFLKLDAHWLIREGRSPGGINRISQMKKQLDSAGIDLIVEKIEAEEDLRELLDFSVDFGQGYLFGKPDIATTQSLAGSKRRVA